MDIVMKMRINRPTIQTLRCWSQSIFQSRSRTASKTSFSADEDIALCLELTRKEDSDDEITLLYVIRNANGEPVSDASAQLTWDQMWHERRHTSTIPNPGAAGEYTLEVYVNRQLLKSIDFAIS